MDLKFVNCFSNALNHSSGHFISMNLCFTPRLLNPDGSDRTQIAQINLAKTDDYFTGVTRGHLEGQIPSCILSVTMDKQNDVLFSNMPIIFVFVIVCFNFSTFIALAYNEH